MNIKVVDETARLDFCHSNNLSALDSDEWILLHKAIFPLIHVVIVRSPSINQVGVVIASDRLTRRRKIHLPNCAFLTLLVASSFHGALSVNN